VLGVKLAETLRSQRQGLNLPALGIVALARLVLAPVLAWWIAGAVGLQGLGRDVTVLESATPTAVVTTILATEFDSDPPFAAMCVLVTTLCSLGSLTLWLNWLS
jgi:predicted permease